MWHHTGLQLDVHAPHGAVFVNYQIQGHYALVAPASMAERLAPTSRHSFMHQGRLVYEWDQTLSEVNMYLPVPADLKAKEIFCDISKHHLKFGRQGNPPFMDVSVLPAAI